MSLLGFTDGLSLLKNPFSSEKIKSMTLFIKRLLFDDGGDFEFSAHIDFENGDTKGQQKIKARDFNELVAKIEAFIKTLEK